MKKVYSDATSALAGLLKDGMTVMSGGFGLCGIPESLILAIRESGVKNLTVISNNAGVDGIGLGILLETRQIRKMISSYVGENKLFAQQFLAGELELQLTGHELLGEQLVLADIGRDHLSYLARLQEHAETPAVDAGIVGDHGQPFDPRLLDGLDQHLRDAAKAEATRHDDHVVLEEARKSVLRIRINLAQKPSPLSSRALRPYAAAAALQQV